jgi:hypothetical protein
MQMLKEKVEKDFRKDPKTGKQVCSFGNLVHGPIGEGMMKRKIRQFNADQNIGTITLKALDFFCFQKI